MNKSDDMSGEVKIYYGLNLLLDSSNIQLPIDTSLFDKNEIFVGTVYDICNNPKSYGTHNVYKLDGTLIGKTFDGTNFTQLKLFYIKK